MSQEVHLPRAAGQESDLPENERLRCRMSYLSLDWSDRYAVLAWLDRLRVHLAEADAMSRDMLRRPHKRELGPAAHKVRYRAAWEQVLEELDYATPPEGGGTGHPGPLPPRRS